MLGNLEIIEYLFQKGGNIQHSDDVGISLLHVASMKGYTNIVEFLIKNGININVQVNFFFNFYKYKTFRIMD